MRTLKITKDNYLQYVDTVRYSPYCYGGSPDKWFNKQLKRLCQIMPEFTHSPQLVLVAMTKAEKQDYNANGFAKLLAFESDYFYGNDGKCIARFCDTYFGFDGNKFSDYEALEIDIESFGIKQATEARIKKLCGLASYT